MVGDMTYDEPQFDKDGKLLKNGNKFFSPPAKPSNLKVNFQGRLGDDLNNMKK